MRDVGDMYISFSFHEASVVISGVEC